MYSPASLDTVNIVLFPLIVQRGYAAQSSTRHGGFGSADAVTMHCTTGKQIEEHRDKRTGSENWIILTMFDSKNQSHFIGRGIDVLQLFLFICAQCQGM